MGGGSSTQRSSTQRGAKKAGAVVTTMRWKAAGKAAAAATGTKGGGVGAKVGSKAFSNVRASGEDCEWRVLCGDIDRPCAVCGGVLV